jgi:dihydrofolate reductase
MTRVAIVAAVAENGIIGREGALPWNLPDDLRHFKAVTMGKPILMGRRTFDSIGRPLPGRRNLVLTRSRLRAPDGVEYVHTFEQAVALSTAETELCVIGGAEIYALALPHARRIYLTRVQAHVAGDVRFPLQDLGGWRELERSEHAADERHAYAMVFVTLERGG